MKIFQFLSLTIILALSSCNAPVEDSGEIPAELDAKKEMLKTLRADIRNTTQKIKELEAAIAEQDPNFAPKLALVTATSVVKDNFDNYASLQATVQADETAMAGPEIPGRILSMSAEEGDEVRRGQLIATLDVESVATQKAELETAINLAKIVFERQERLWEQKIGSELQYLEAKNNYERLQQNLKNIDVQLAKANVYAPISGTVQQVFMRAGENAMPGAPIIAIISTGKLKIVADAPEEFLTKVKKGQRVKVNVPTLEESFTAPVSRIGKTVDPANRTFKVDVKVPSSTTRKLKTNLLAELEILEETIEDAIIISQDMVQREVTGQQFLFVVAAGEEEGQKIAKKVFVNTGKSFGNQVIIVEGLSVGDQLITTGSRGLVDGQAITVNLNTENNGK